MSSAGFFNKDEQDVKDMVPVGILSFG